MKNCIVPKLIRLFTCVLLLGVFCGHEPLRADSDRVGKTARAPEFLKLVATALAEKFENTMPGAYEYFPEFKQAGVSFLDFANIIRNTDVCDTCAGRYWRPDGYKEEMLLNRELRGQVMTVVILPRYITTIETLLHEDFDEWGQVDIQNAMKSQIAADAEQRIMAEAVSIAKIVPESAAQKFVAQSVVKYMNGLPIVGVDPKVIRQFKENGIAGDEFGFYRSVSGSRISVRYSFKGPRKIKSCFPREYGRYDTDLRVVSGSLAESVELEPGDTKELAFSSKELGIRSIEFKSAAFKTEGCQEIVELIDTNSGQVLSWLYDLSTLKIPGYPYEVVFFNLP